MALPFARTAVLISALSLLAACGQGNDDAPAAAPATSPADTATAPAAVAGPVINRVRTLTGKPDREKLQKLKLQPVQVASGSFAAPRAGSVGSIAFMVGTGSNRPEGERSDGRLAVKVCKAADCRSGLADITTAEDNAMLEAVFDAPLLVAQGDTLQYEANLDGARNRLVIWLYPTRDGSPLIAVDGGKPLKKFTPKIEVGYTD